MQHVDKPKNLQVYIIITWGKAYRMGHALELVYFSYTHMHLLREHMR